MKNDILKIFIGSVFVLQLLSGCGVEPDERPTDLELLCRTYKSVTAIYNNLSIEIINDSTKLELSSDLTYSLVFLGRTLNGNYNFTIRQEGVFELTNTSYVRNCGEALCNPFLAGTINFISDDGETWGGQFKYIKLNYVLSFQENPIPIFDDNGIKIHFDSWWR